MCKWFQNNKDTQKGSFETKTNVAEESQKKDYLARLNECEGFFAAKAVKKAKEDFARNIKKISLGGSARIQQETGAKIAPKDIDLFTSDKEVYEYFDEYFSSTCPRLYVSVPTGGVENYNYNGRILGSRAVMREQVVEGVYHYTDFHLNLVEEVLPLVEQIKMHLKKKPQHVEAIITTKFRGWEQVVFDLKIANTLKGDLQNKYILWLSDTGKL